MTVLVVIPCLNEAENLPRLIEGLLADSQVGLIVVADGRSTDRSRTIVNDYATRDERVVLLDNPQVIQSAGINRAVSLYGHRFTWLVRIDAHCNYPDGYVATLIEAARHTGAGSVVVPMKTIGTDGFQRSVAVTQNSMLGTGGSAHRHVESEGQFVDHGHHALMSIADFKLVGGYCEAMHCNEDAELDHRLGQANVRIWLEPKAAISYIPRSTPGGLWRQYYRYGQGRARNMIRHRTPFRPRQALPLLVPVAVALAILAIPLHWSLAVPLMAWVSIVLVGGAIVGILKGGFGALLAGVPALIMHSSWALGFLHEWLVRSSGVPSQYGFAPQGSDRA